METDELIKKFIEESPELGKVLAHFDARLAALERGLGNSPIFDRDENTDKQKK